MPLHCRECKISREIAGHERLCRKHYPEPDLDAVAEVLDDQ